MTTEIVIDGYRYKTKECSSDAEEVANKFYNLFMESDRSMAIKLNLEDSSFLVLGTEAAKKAHIIFKP